MSNVCREFFSPPCKRPIICSASERQASQFVSLPFALIVPVGLLNSAEKGKNIPSSNVSPSERHQLQCIAACTSCFPSRPVRSFVRFHRIIIMIVIVITICKKVASDSSKEATMLLENLVQQARARARYKPAEQFELIIISN